MVCGGRGSHCGLLQAWEDGDRCSDPFNVALKSGLALTDQELFTGRPSLDPPPQPPLTVSCGPTHLPPERVHHVFPLVRKL